MQTELDAYVQRWKNALQTIPDADDYHWKQTEDEEGLRNIKKGDYLLDEFVKSIIWFIAVYFMSESKKGMSANQLKRSLGVSYKTAWYLCHRIRKAMEEATDNEPKFNGIVEVDETYVGGKYDKRRKRGPWEKQAVIGLLQRKGAFEARAIPTNGKKILYGIIGDRVNKNARVMTDEYAGYKGIDKEYNHESVNHHKDESVRGDVYANGVENAWCHPKKCLTNVSHRMTIKVYLKKPNHPRGWDGKRWVSVNPLSVVKGG